MNNTKIIICIIILVAVIIVIGYVGLNIGIPYFMLAHEDEILRVQLENPYIDSDYDEWQQHSIEGIGNFMLPEEWNISQNGDMYEFLDEKDNLIANGALLDSDKYDDTLFISSLTNMKSEKLDYERAAHMDGSSFGSMIVNDGNQEQSLYFLKLVEYKGKTLVVVFQPENNVVTDTLLEAILFSYEMIEY